VIDLHIHTTWSDGSETPEAILAKAQQAGLEYVSITDHNSIGAYEELQRSKTRGCFAGKIVPGCELSVVHEGKPIEILGYGMDLEAMNCTGIVSGERFLERENGYLKSMMRVCKSLDLTFSSNLCIGSGRYFATQIMHADLRKYPENEGRLPKGTWGNLNAFYRTCVTNPESPFFLDKMKDYPTVREAADLIKKAGGKAFLAHLYGYLVDGYEEFLNSIISLDALDGIECYHSLHSLDKTEHLLRVCHEHNLCASGGSDYHGKIKPAVKIGESVRGVNIPFEILEPWLPSNLV
jgi:predicted metal-dependent phosphoesterase TrpH